MLFNSLSFMIFFPIVLLIYWIVPAKFRYIWLLIASYYFYMNWSIKYGLLIFLTTCVTYVSGFVIERYRKYKKGALIISLLVNFGILIFFKYANFLIDNTNYILKLFGQKKLSNINLMLPVGISFYTFQALSYTIDVYRGDIKAEKNFGKYALFVSFFPQLVAGPIERTGNLLKQIDDANQIKVFNYKRIVNGFIMMLYGLFLKMVIADRLSILVDNVFNSYEMYKSTELLVAAIGFAIQIYCDFGSYSTIAIGAAEVMGFQLMENFNTPYFAMSIKDFWRRWHISLSQWLKDYVYISLGGNRCSKARKYFNIMVTFIISGLWHGADWTYVIWGGLHGFYQVLGEVVKQWREKIFANVKKDCFSYRMGKMILTFTLVDFAWIFFRVDNVKDAFGYIGRLFSKINMWAWFDGTLYTLGLNRMEMNILFFSVSILVLVDYIRYKKKIRLDVFLEDQNLWFKWGTIFVLFFMILIFGEYGATFDAKQFIYFQF